MADTFSPETWHCPHCGQRFKRRGVRTRHVQAAPKFCKKPKPKSKPKVNMPNFGRPYNAKITLPKAPWE